MVDEFSNFARLPAPTMQQADLSDLCRQQIFLQRNGNPSLTYDLDLPEIPIQCICDGRQIAQVLTNILQNAKEGIDGRAGDALAPGRIALSLRREGETVRITIDDNGKGFPAEGREQLTEPYVTYRERGTGLGLAIVKKIMEDHGGAVDLLDAPAGGARVVLAMPADLQPSNPAAGLE